MQESASFNPVNLYTHAPALKIPPCGTPFPVDGAQDEFRPDRIVVDVIELLLQFLGAVEVKRVAFGLPESIARSEVREVVRRLFFVPLPYGEAAHALPAMNEPSEALRIVKPDLAMDVVRHEHEANALGRERFELMIENAQQNALGLVQVKQLAPLENRECDKANELLVNVMPSLMVFAFEDWLNSYVRLS